MPADLGRVVGGMLAGVAEARSLADRYSRALALAYEQDDLLRAFPVPRIEIADMTVELHFAVESLEGTAQPPTAQLIQRTTKDIAGAVASTLATLRVRRAPATVTRLIGSAVQAELEKAAALAGALPEGASAAAFDVDRLATVVIARLSKSGAKLPAAAQARIREVLATLAPAHTQAFGDLRAAGAFSGLLLNVRVTHQELATLPAQAISVARLTLGIRNYEWHQVDDVNGKPVRKLVPE